MVKVVRESGSRLPRGRRHRADGRDQGAVPHGRRRARGQGVVERRGGLRPPSEPVGHARGGHGGGRPPQRSAPDAGARHPLRGEGRGSAGEAITSYGFLRIPGEPDLTLALRAGTTAREVDERDSVVFDMADLVGAPRGADIEVGTDVAASGARPSASCTRKAAPRPVRRGGRRALGRRVRRPRAVGGPAGLDLPVGSRADPGAGSAARAARRLGHRRARSDDHL